MARNHPLDRLPAQVEGPLAVVVGVDALAVDRGQPGQRDVREEPTGEREDGLEDTLLPRRQVHVEERAVQEHPVEVLATGTSMRVQHGDETTGRMAVEHDPLDPLRGLQVSRLQQINRVGAQ